MLIHFYADKSVVLIHFYEGIIGFSFENMGIIAIFARINFNTYNHEAKHIFPATEMERVGEQKASDALWCTSSWQDLHTKKVWRE
jgi:hypothetical protein